MKENAPGAELQFQSDFRRKPDGIKETWDELCNQILYAPQTGLLAIGKFNFKQKEIIQVEGGKAATTERVLEVAR